MREIWQWLQSLPWLVVPALLMLLVVITIFILRHDRTLRRRNTQDRRKSCPPEVNHPANERRSNIERRQSR